MKKLILLCLVSFSSIASDYPPGYVMESSCQQLNQVRVCALNQRSGWPQLRIEYPAPAVVSVWVRLNGRQDMFPLKGSVTVLNAFQNVHRCFVVRAGEVLPQSEYSACPATYRRDLPQDAQNLVWYSEAPKTYEAKLFENVQGNIWDVELAFVDEIGNWDSRYGENYKFKFNP